MPELWCMREKNILERPVKSGYLFIQKITAGFLFLLCSYCPFSVVAQANTPAAATEHLRDEQGSFLWYINYFSSDSNILYSLPFFVEHEMDSIHRFIMTDSVLGQDEKIKAIETQVYFMMELSRYASYGRAELYNVPAELDAYKRLLKALLSHESYRDMLAPVDPRLCQMLANTFWQYDECGLLEDIAVYKRVASSPDFILDFVENTPGFRFADSLLLIAAANNALKMTNYLLQDKPGLQELMRNTKNIYLQEISLLSKYKDASELLPFVVPLAEKRMTPEEIIEKRTDVTGYFQLLVNTLKYEMSRSDDSTVVFQTLLRNAIREKSISFYVNEINALHESRDDVRFAAAKALRAEDIYYVVTSCKEELYTSSYLGLYLRLRDRLQPSPADSIFSIVQFDNFRNFMRIGADYNTLADFLSCMHPEKAGELLKRFIAGIESDVDSALEKAMDIADSFTGLSNVPGISDLLENELRSNLDRCQAGQSYLGVRLYSILLQVYEQLKQKDPANKLWTNLDNHEVLERRSLQDKNGEIIELVLFYGDKDGIASFSNFLKLFTDPDKWTITQNEFWVTIRSLTPEALVIYANLPLDNASQLDLQAQDSLNAFLQQHAIVPVILVHRGHSYHLGNTLRSMQPTVKLAILGSCGGHNNILSIANISPDAQIIVSKKTGSKYINDPMIDVINQTLLDNEDLRWTKVWEKLEIRFRKDAFALNLFNEYIPPTKNVSLFVLRLFNSYKWFF